MKLLRTGLLTLLAMVAASALQAQTFWKWRTKDGRIEVSDRAPPVDIPEANILQRPNGPRPVPAATPSANADDAAAAASGAPGAQAAQPPMPAASRVDSDLEAKKRKQQADLAAKAQAKQRADTERLAAQKAENCRRARNQQAGLESGVRITRSNEKGEREFLDDQGRAAELQRTRQLVASNCG